LNCFSTEEPETYVHAVERILSALKVEARESIPLAKGSEYEAKETCIDSLISATTCSAKRVFLWASLKQYLSTKSCSFYYIVSRWASNFV
jgi:hypothetical protein